MLAGSSRPRTAPGVGSPPITMAPKLPRVQPPCDNCVSHLGKNVHFYSPRTVFSGRQGRPGPQVARNQLDRYLLSVYDLGAIVAGGALLSPEATAFTSSLLSMV